MNTLGLKDYNPDEFRLFFDFSKRSLKAVLLNNGNKVALLPIADSVHLEETHENLKMLLQSIQYDKHKWSICGVIIKINKKEDIFTSNRIYLPLLNRLNL